MSGLPSIVAGLFIFAVFILPYAKDTPLFGFNGFMASLALALLMLPDHHPHRRGGAAPGARRPARGQPGHGRVASPHHVVGGVPDRPHRHHHRRGPGHRPGGGRDGPAAVHRVRLRPHERQPVRQAAGEPAAVRLQQHPQAGPGLDRRVASPGRWCSWCSCWACSCWPASSGATARSARGRRSAPDPARTREPVHERSRRRPPRRPAAAAPGVVVRRSRRRPGVIELIGGPPPGEATPRGPRRLRLVRRPPRARGRRPGHAGRARSPRSSGRRAVASPPSCAC